MPLVDAELGIFALESLEIWLGFGARDGDRGVSILVETDALKRVWPGAPARQSLQSHRAAILLAAQDIYEILEKADEVRISDGDLYKIKLQT